MTEALKAEREAIQNLVESYALAFHAAIAHPASHDKMRDKANRIMDDILDRWNRCTESAELAALMENGPVMRRGNRMDGTPWIGTMRECLNDAKQAADVEARYADDIRAELEALRRDAEWRPIESAPRDGTMFLCWVAAVRFGETDEGQQYQQDVSQFDFCEWRSIAELHGAEPGDGYWDNTCGQIADHQGVTHWMPLPAAPSTDTERKT